METTDLKFRIATDEDLATIIELFADDPFGSKREKPGEPLPESYRAAFKVISEDPNNEMIVAEIGEEIVAVLQIVFFPQLTFQGHWRALVESVRVKKSCRRSGIGKKLFEWVITRAKERDCLMIQLTTEQQRTEAFQFYQSLGFVNSHKGMKLFLK